LVIAAWIDRSVESCGGASIRAVGDVVRDGIEEFRDGVEIQKPDHAESDVGSDIGSCSAVVIAVEIIGSRKLERANASLIVEDIITPPEVGRV
jgi:hypothetical protein